MLVAEEQALRILWLKGWYGPGGPLEDLHPYAVVPPLSDPQGPDFEVHNFVDDDGGLMPLESLSQPQWEAYINWKRQAMHPDLSNGLHYGMHTAGGSADPAVSLAEAEERAASRLLASGWYEAGLSPEERERRKQMHPYALVPLLSDRQAPAFEVYNFLDDDGGLVPVASMTQEQWEAYVAWISQPDALPLEMRLGIYIAQQLAHRETMRDG